MVNKARHLRTTVYLLHGAEPCHATQLQYSYYLTTLREANNTLNAQPTQVTEEVVSLSATQVDQ